MSVAISRVFGTAMSGKCKEKPELAAIKLPLKAKIMMLPVKEEKRLFTGSLNL